MSSSVYTFSWLKYKPQPLFLKHLSKGPRTGGSQPQGSNIIIWGGAEVIIEIKYTENVMQLNHRKTIPPPLVWKNCLPWNCSLVSKRLGMVAHAKALVKITLVGRGRGGVGEGTRHNGESKGCWGGKLWMKKLKQRENGCLNSLSWFFD